MEIVKLEAKPRVESGKGPAKRLRREGKIPAVTYGKGREATSIAVSPRALLRALDGAHGRNCVMELELEGGEKRTVMLGDYTYHPVTRQLLHADFVQIALDEPVDVMVPFETVGRAPGVVLGGTMLKVYRKLPVRCLPQQIPAVLKANVGSMGVNTLMKVSDLDLPEGVSVRLPAEQTIVSVSAPRRVESATEEAEKE